MSLLSKVVAHLSLPLFYHGDRSMSLPPAQSQAEAAHAVHPTAPQAAPTSPTSTATPAATPTAAPSHETVLKTVEGDLAAGVSNVAAAAERLSADIEKLFEGTPANPTPAPAPVVAPVPATAASASSASPAGADLNSLAQEVSARVKAHQGYLSDMTAANTAVSQWQAKAKAAHDSMKANAAALTAANAKLTTALASTNSQVQSVVSQANSVA